MFFYTRLRRLYGGNPINFSKVVNFGNLLGANKLETLHIENYGFDDERQLSRWDIEHLSTMVDFLLPGITCGEGDIHHFSNLRTLKVWNVPLDSDWVRDDVEEDLVEALEEKKQYFKKSEKATKVLQRSYPSVRNIAIENCDVDQYSDYGGLAFFNAKQLNSLHLGEGSCLKHHDPEDRDHDFPERKSAPGVVKPPFVEGPGEYQNLTSLTELCISWHLIQREKCLNKLPRNLLNLNRLAVNFQVEFFVFFNKHLLFLFSFPFCFVIAEDALRRFFVGTQIVASYSGN